jgi:hypothetical protein
MREKSAIILEYAGASHVDSLHYKITTEVFLHVIAIQIEIILMWKCGRYNGSSADAGVSSA